MENIYKKLMSFTDEDFDRIEREEEDLLKQLGAEKLHEFDNIAVGKNGEIYALCDLCENEDIIKNGNIAAKTKKAALRGEIIDL